MQLLKEPLYYLDSILTTLANFDIVIHYHVLQKSISSFPDIQASTNLRARRLLPNMSSALIHTSIIKDSTASYANFADTTASQPTFLHGETDASDDSETKPTCR